MQAITAYTNDKTQIQAIKSVLKALKIEFRVSEHIDKPYNEVFIAKIRKSQQQISEGQTVKIDLDQIWK